MRLLERFGIINGLTRLLRPVLTLLGISDRAAPLAIVGMTLGLTYGGGLIIQEARAGHLSRHDVFCALALLGTVPQLHRGHPADDGHRRPSLRHPARAGPLFALLVTFLIARLLRTPPRHRVSTAGFSAAASNDHLVSATAPGVLIRDRAADCRLDRYRHELPFRKPPCSMPVGLLFGDEVSLGPEFLGYLQPSGAKSAFRTQAKQHHPDRLQQRAAPEVRARQTERFREIHQAYHLLANTFLARRHQRPRATAPGHGRTLGRRRHAAAPEPRRNSRRCRWSSACMPTIAERSSYRDLIEALVWQRRQRPSIGAIACQWGWLNEAKVRRILGHRGTMGRFGRRAVELGLL